MPMLIRLHWLVAGLLIFTCVTLQLCGLAEPGTSLGYVPVVTHFNHQVKIFTMITTRLLGRLIQLYIVKDNALER